MSVVTLTMSVKWRLMSEAWTLNELARKVGDTLIALSLLKFLTVDKIPLKESEDDLRRRVYQVKPILELILKDIDNAIKEHRATPLIESLQEEYGYANVELIKNRVKEALDALEHINKKDYKKKWFDITERLLESLAKSASLRSYQLISRAKPVL